MTTSILTKNQTKTFTKLINDNYKLSVVVRYDDQCDNGHNSFSITGTLYKKRRTECCGSIHDIIAKYMPELKPYIKWHLVSSEQPLFYLDNTIYHANNNNLEHARMTAVWPDATLDQLKDKDALMARLPALMAEFKTDMESLGFTY